MDGDRLGTSSPAPRGCKRSSCCSVANNVGRARPSRTRAATDADVIKNCFVHYNQFMSNNFVPSKGSEWQLLGYEFDRFRKSMGIKRPANNGNVAPSVEAVEQGTFAATDTRAAGIAKTPQHKVAEPKLGEHGRCEFCLLATKVTLGR